jgi:hypothetical protein
MTSIEEIKRELWPRKKPNNKVLYIKESFWTLFNVELSFINLEIVTTYFKRNLKFASLVENMTIGHKIVLKKNMLIQKGRHAKLLV